MNNLDPRIRNALISIDPTTKRPAWHGVPTAIGVLRGVDPVVAVWRPYPDCNNIRELALHIAFWENSIANQLSSIKINVGCQPRKTSWPIKLESIEETQWKREVNQIKEIHKRLTEAVTQFDADKLDQPAGKQTTRNAIEFIHGVAEHQLYHTAQMDMIKTLAKNQGRG